MPELPELIDGPDDLNARLLREFGLTTEPFTTAIARARLEWATCTANDPPSFPGTVFWASVVRYLREELLTLGWHKDDPRNFSRSISPDGTKAIVVETGDENTGICGPRMPRTKSPKGSATLDAIQVNREQLDLFTMTPGPTLRIAENDDESDQDDGRLLTYLFLVRLEDGRCYSELSLPLVPGDDHRIVNWSVRMIMPVLNEGHEPPPISATPPEPAIDPDVHVVRRKA